MKVLYVLHSTEMSGATISFLNMVRGICQKGYSVVIVIPCEDSVIRSAINEIGGRCVLSKMVSSACPTNSTLIDLLKIWVLKLWSFASMMRIVLIEHPDIIHTNTGVIHETFWISRILGYPHVWHLREYQDCDFNWKIIPSKVFFEKCLQKSFVVSITSDIHRHFGLKEGFKHRVIYNGILPKTFSSLQPQKEKYFLCSSRVSPEKGLEDVVVCFAHFYKTHPDYRLIILGFGEEWYISYLKNLCKDLCCKEAVLFLGFQKDITSYMKSAKALIVGSYYEGFGRMTAEAAFCGCVVIGRNTGGTKEIMDVTGGFPFITREDLLEQMERVSLMDTSDYCKHASFAQEKAIAMYSNENNVELIDKFYNDILDGRKDGL